MFDRLKRSYDEGEIVEISAMAGLFNYFNRVNDALCMQPTRPGEGL
jgi:hypothetical protein